MTHEHTNKDLNRLRWFSPEMRVNTVYTNSTKGVYPLNHDNEVDITHKSTVVDRLCFVLVLKQIMSWEPVSSYFKEIQSTKKLGEEDEWTNEWMNKWINIYM